LTAPPDGVPATAKATPPGPEPRPAPGRVLEIDEEFRRLAPPLSKAERAALEQRLRTDRRCLEPIIAWRDIILDGYNRYEICNEWGIPYTVQAMDLPDREAAKRWIVQHQMDKRNLVGLGLPWMQAVRYELEKRRAGGTGANQHQGAQRDQTDHAAPRTDDRLAGDYNCSPATIRRNAPLLKHMEQIVAKAGPEAQPVVLSPDSRCKRIDVKWLAELPAEELKGYVAQMASGTHFLAAWRLQGERPRWVRLPREPRALAAALARHLSLEDLRVVCQELQRFVNDADREAR
jgi:hypothetical protein